jgi:hypothetical protein
MSPFTEVKKSKNLTADRAAVEMAPKCRLGMSSMNALEPSLCRYKCNAIPERLKSSCNGVAPFTHIDWEYIGVHWTKYAPRFQGSRHHLVLSVDQMMSPCSAGNLRENHHDSHDA